MKPGKALEVVVGAVLAAAVGGLLFFFINVTFKAMRVFQ